VAMENASGGGRRKKVPGLYQERGMNVAMDPIMVANLTGTHAGLVWLIGDDPGAWARRTNRTAPPGALARCQCWSPPRPKKAMR